MATSSGASKSWRYLLTAIIAIGILSRVLHTGLVVIDKYLGDALYAAMMYTILRLRWRSAPVAIPAMVLMIGIESFQLTMIPARMLENQYLLVRICARLIGTEFSFFDLLAYALGIGCIYVADSVNTPAQM